MILKVRRKKHGDEDTMGKFLIEDYYESSSFRNKDGSMISEEGKDIIITNYSQIDEITGLMWHYDIVDAYLMNNEGKTIERITII